MRKSVVLVLIAAAAAFAGDTPAGPARAAGDVSGPVTYLDDGVALAGRKTAWKDLRTLEDVAPSAAETDALTAEFERRRKLRTADVAAHLTLADWARDKGLAGEARSEYEAALALDAENAAARRALGWVRVEEQWLRTADVFDERRRALPKDGKAAKLALAKWCADNGFPDGEWTLLVELAAADPWDKGMIPRVKAAVARRMQRTPLVPPLAGLWQAAPDPTRHHQAKVFAIEAIDFRKVDEGGKLFRGTGKKLEDWYGFDSVIYACADGIVWDADDHFPDLPPGAPGKFDEANYVEIEHEAGEHTDYGHIRRGSALVKKGDAVKAGQPIARVGNSGASGQPHLHFTMDMAVFDDAGNSEWISIPWRLRGFRVVEAGGARCDFEAKVARVLEGWRVLFPERK